MYVERRTPASPSASASFPTAPASTSSRTPRATPLYVGKAMSLRKRAANYLVRRPRHAPAGDARGGARRRVVVTDTEAEALLLENNWIKQPAARATTSGCATTRPIPTSSSPCRTSTRGSPSPGRIEDDGAEYFGPFLPGRPRAQGDQAGAEAVPGPGLPTSRSTASCRGPASTTTCTAASAPASPGSPPRRPTTRPWSRRGSSSPAATRS